MIMKKLFIWIFVMLSGTVSAQVRKLTLEEVVQQSKEQSIASKQAVTQKKTNYWQYRSFQADYKPQLSLLGTVPGFTRSYIQVVQPDGTVSFQQVSNNNSTLNLSLSQSIAMTGGTIYMQQQMQRFDDFQRDVTRYNGIPFEIGIKQPLFQFNPLKWDRKISPLKYQEGNQQYIQSLEQVALDATGF